MKYLLWLVLWVPLLGHALADQTVSCGGANPCSNVVVAPIPITTTTYFVDCAAGNDASATPTNFATPWRTVGKVNTSVSATGADVMFKSGTTCTDAALTIDWAGTSSDRSVIGSYYVSGGVAYQVFPDQDPTFTPPRSMTFANPRAIIQGTYRPSCRVWPTQCAFNTGAAIPSSVYLAMVFIDGYAYVTVQSLDIRDSAGGGIIVDGQSAGFWPCTGQAACQDYAIVQYNRIDHTAYTALLLQATSYAIVRGNLVSYTGLNRVDSQAPGNDGMGFLAATCDPCHFVVENNDFSNIWNETIVPGSASFVLLRGNILSNGERVGIYTDGSADIIGEQNIVSSGRYVWETGLGNPANAGGFGGPIFCSLCLVKEPSWTSIGNVANATLRVVYRNNLVASYSGCLYIGIDADNVAPGSGGFWGNSCIGASGANGVVSSGGAGGISTLGIDFQNNILASTTGSPVCSANLVSAKITYSKNLWTGTPNAACQGVGDVTSSFSALGLPGGFQHFNDADYANLPVAADFAISNLSTAANAGGNLSATYLTIANWQWEYDNMTWHPACSSRKPTAAEWAQKNGVDYCNNVRVAWDIGAINRLGTPITVGAAPVYVSSITDEINSVGGTLTIRVTSLTTLTAGQGLVMVCASEGVITTLPSGWTLAGSQPSAQPRMYVFWKIAASSESNPTVSSAAAAKVTCTTQNYNNANPTFMDATPLFQTTGGGSGLSSPTITPTVANTVVISAVTDDFIVTYTAPPAGYTLVNQVLNSGAALWFGVARGPQATATPTGVLTWTATQSGANTTATSFALRGN